MICDADTVGVFQIESRAQMSMLPRLRPRCFYDLVIEVAIVRPGPIQGQMVHPYLRRRDGREPVVYPDERVKKVLGKTLGVPLFQEQAMQLAIVAAGFSPDEADQLRRAIASWKSKQNLIHTFGQRLIHGMTTNGYDRGFAERCFKQIQGFSEYGFPESHAASFALIVYVSAWLKHYHPAAFAAALINSQPMGFYAPAQIVRDAKQHNVDVRPVDVNFSRWDCVLEEEDEVEATERRSDEATKGRKRKEVFNGEACPAMRLGMRVVKGLRRDDAVAIAHAVEQYGRLSSIDALWRATGVRLQSLRKLAEADAFNSMDLDRQHALWQIRSLHNEHLPLFESESSAPSSLRRFVAPSLLPSLPQPTKVVHDYASMGLSLKAHPVSFLRDKLDAIHVTRAHDLQDEILWPGGAPIAVAGVVLVRQRPRTASGVVFMTIEDETGVANLILKPDIFERHRKAARHSVFILAKGHVERQGKVVHVMTDSVEDFDAQMLALTCPSRDFH